MNNNNEFVNVPEQLKRSPDWLTWRRQPRDGKIAKKPNIFNPNKDIKIEWDNRELLTYKEAINEYERCPGTNDGLEETTIVQMEKELRTPIAADGVGFAFRTYNDIAGIDLDHALDESGNISPTAKAVLNAARGCYVEVSLSGSGFHIYGICDKTKMLETYGKSSFQNKEKGIEVYFRSHYFVVTGKRWMNGWGSIESAVQTCYNLINGTTATTNTEQSVAANQEQTERSGVKMPNTNTQSKNNPSVAANSNQAERSGEYRLNTNTQSKNNPSVAANAMPSKGEYTDADILRLPAMDLQGVRYIMNKEEPVLDTVLRQGYSAAPLTWGQHADGSQDKSAIDMKVCGLLANYYHRYGIDTIVSIFKQSALNRSKEKANFEEYIYKTASIAYNAQKTWFAAVNYRQISYREKELVKSWVARSKRK